MLRLLLVAAIIGVSSAHHDNTVHELKAVALVRGPRDEVQGNVTFTQMIDGKVRVEGTILGLSHGQYGFHVHEKGDLTGGCLSAGGHFNPEHKPHGHPKDLERHVGDLGNIEFDDTRISRIDFIDDQISLLGTHSIIGRSVVIHEKADDFGRSAHPDSKKTGNAGGRVACGVIGILDPVEGWKTSSATRSIFFASTAPILMLIALL